MPTTMTEKDAARAEVSGKSLRETRDRSLRKRIDRTADEWHALAVGTANVNDTPAFAQMPRGFLCRNEQPVHIDGDQLLEIFKRELLDRRDDSDARVVHENVNAPKGSDGFRNGQSDSLRVGGVRFDRQRFSARRLDPANDFI